MRVQGCQIPDIVIKPGREKSLVRRHPWIFSGAVLAVHGSPKTGETVDVLSASGGFLARAAFSPNSNIVGRVWTWDPTELVNPDFLQRRFKQALELRENMAGFIPSNAMRLGPGEPAGLR